MRCGVWARCSLSRQTWSHGTQAHSQLSVSRLRGALRQSSPRPDALADAFSQGPRRIMRPYKRPRQARPDRETNHETREATDLGPTTRSHTRAPHGSPHRRATSHFERHTRRPVLPFVPFRCAFATSPCATHAKAVEILVRICVATEQSYADHACHVASKTNVASRSSVLAKHAPSSTPHAVPNLRSRAAQRAQSGTTSPPRADSLAWPVLTAP